MATETITRLIDDLDGSPADLTLNFAVDGVGYEIDLSAGNADILRTALAPFLDRARRGNRPARVTSRRRASPTARTPSIDLSRVREWAVREGHAIAARGRIAQSLIEAYLAAEQAATHAVAAAPAPVTEPAADATVPAAARTPRAAKTAPRTPRPSKRAAAGTTGAAGVAASGADDATPAVTGEPSLDELRAWASENGMTTAPRGRISRAVRQAYLAAHTPTEIKTPTPKKHPTKTRTPRARKQTAGAARDSLTS